MKRIPVVAFVIFMASCNSGNEKPNTADSLEIPTPDTVTTYSGVDSSSEFLDSFSTTLQPWLDQTMKNPHVKLRDFKYAENWVDDSIVTAKQNTDKDFLKTYRSVLVYSPDEKKVLDMGSYGTVITKTKKGESSIVHGEPDIEIAIIDLGTQKRRRIFFSGPGSLIQKGFWMNDSTVLLAGKNHEQNAEIPMLWTITLNDKANLITRYEYTLR